MNKHSFHEGRKGARIAGPAVLILALIAIVTAMATAQKADIKTENGVRVVRNPRTPVAGPGGAPTAVSIAEDLVIGNDTSRENYWFGFLNSLAVDDAGRIYTLDPKDIRVRVFGPDGSLIRAFGRQGQGPGEFSGPGGILVAPDGTIVVTDVLNGRISYFSREGVHLKDMLYGTYRIAGLAIDGRSNLIATHAQAPSGDKQTWELIKFDRDLKPLMTVHAISIPFKPRVMNFIPDRLFFALAGDDRLAWMVSNDYAVQVVDSSGKAVMKIIKDRDLQKFTAKDREKIIKSRFPSGAPPQFEIQTPEYFPAASGFMTDDKGRIYVRTYESDGRGGVAIDVFDPSGLYIARFFVPEGEDDVTIRNDKLYSIVNDPASGNPLVKRYALKWK
jgi:sugar lactone lactonase YvrE